MRVESLLLVLACLAPALAIRGERRPIRDLRGSDGDKDVFESRRDKAQNEEKEKGEKGEKKDPGNIAEKKDKGHMEKKCKKAKKGMKSKKDKNPNQIRRYAEVLREEEMKFCLHSSDLSQEQCDKVKKGEKLPKDGSVKGGLDIELVHTQERSSGDILDNVNDILSKDTNTRFVGCEDLDSPPPAKKSNKVRHSRTRRFLEEYETVLEKEDTVDVTGVDFEDLDIVAGACKTQTIFQDGMVCDRIRSNVQIFYKSLGTLSVEDEEDMYNLLVETILAQASVGSFGELGDVASVKVAQETTDGEQSNQNGDGDESEGGTSDRGGDLSDVPDPSGGETTFESNRGPILGAAAAFAALFAAGYWYAMGEDEEVAENEFQKNDHTDSDSD